MRLYGLAVFLSALLLFAVQPMIAKAILPWFGGAAAVWVTCLVFFQGVLLLGYLYAHLLVARVRGRAAGLVHPALLLASALMLPIGPDAAWAPAGGEEPAGRLLWLLAASVGLPSLLLAAASPMAQAWYAAAHRASPYRLFAVSNAGSLSGLLAYPLLVEPFLPMRGQLRAWSALYLVTGGLAAALAWRHRGQAPRVPVAAEEPTAEQSPPDRATRLLWVAFPACGAALLYGVTSHLTQNVAAVPFLWVPPLALYLLSFIVCFARRSWYRRGVWLPALAVALGGMAYGLSPGLANASLRFAGPLFLGGLFACCMVCHGELARLRPPPRRLTSFYLAVAAGGALGGLYAGVAAPLAYDGYQEFPVAIATCAVLVLLALRRDPATRASLSGWRPAAVGGVAAVLALGAALWVVGGERAGTRLRVRNFYGSLSVSETSLPHLRLIAGDPVPELAAGFTARKLMHGTVAHGLQYPFDARRHEPTAYYVPDSGVALAVREAAARGPLRVGVVGLGTGTMAAYCRAGDVMRFYELNPLVVELAQREFSYLADSPGTIEIIPGDARLSLEREPPQGYGVLAVDAFAGDAIPLHLLTREAFALYFRHLAPGGVLALHLSNQHLDLPPVAGRLARALGKTAMLVESTANDPAGVFRAHWVLLTERREFFASPEVARRARAVPDRPGLPPWTDDYSNLLLVWK